MNPNQNIQHSEGLGHNQNAEVINNNYTIDPAEEQSIINEIFNYILENSDLQECKNPTDDDGLVDLLEKIAINFSEIQKEMTEELFTSNFEKIYVIDKCIKKKYEINNSDVIDLIWRIRFIFMKYRATYRDSVENINIFELITEEILPSSKKQNITYIAYGRAISLYFFHMCEFGKKRADEGKSCFIK